MVVALTMTNTASKSERAALAGSSTATTLFQQATAHLELEDAGRFGALARERAAKPYVAGVEPAVHYPAGASWTEAAQPLEPPLGFSVDDMPPVGEPHEIAKATPAPGGLALGEGAPAEPQSSSSPPSSTVATSAAVHPAGLEGGGDVASGWPGRVSPKSAPPPTAHERLAQVLPQIIKRRSLR